ncbi:PD40 domain-containing protein [bacterium]|nr:PD40 domain-containing protein [bacterium]
MESTKTVAVLLTLLIAVSCRNSGFTVVKSEYLGMEVPEKGSELYGPGIVSTDEWSEFAGRFSANLQEFRFMREKPDGSGGMFSMRWIGSAWSDPEYIDPESLRKGSSQPVQWEGGSDMVFSRHFEEPARDRQFEIALSADIPELADEQERNMMLAGYGVCCTAASAVYFSAPVAGLDTYDIYRACGENGTSQTPEALGAAVNSPAQEVTIFVSTEDDVLLFSSNRKGGEGGYDIYACRRTISGEWSDAVNLGPAVNTEDDELFPFVLPDESYLLFSRVSNGKGDIYWVAVAEVGGIAPRPESAVALSSRARM